MIRGGMPTFLTACPRNCYSTCAMRVTVEEGRLVKVEAAPENLATAEGPCLKGLSYVERAHSAERITRPLRRRPDGSFVPVSWDEALDAVASALEKARRADGPQSVLYYSGERNEGAPERLRPRLLAPLRRLHDDLRRPLLARRPRGDAAHARRRLAQRAVGPRERAPRRDVGQERRRDERPPDGAPPRGARERGGRSSSSTRGGPRRPSGPRSSSRSAPGPTARSPSRSGTSSSATATSTGSSSTRHVLGFDEWAALVAAWPPERAAAVCGVPVVARSRSSARSSAPMHPATIVPGFGMQRFTNSGQAMRAMLALLAVTGQIGKPGAGWMYANLQTQVFSPVKDPLDFYPPETPDGVVRVSISTARLGRDMLATKDPPLARRLGRARQPDPAEPGDAAPSSRPSARLDFRVVVEEFLTDTAREADVVLPAKNLFEQTDVIGAYWHPYLQLRRKVMEPPPEVKPETEIYRALGRRLGIAEEALAAALPGPSDEAVEAWLDGAARAARPLARQLRRRARSSRREFEEVAFADLRFPTPSGKIELAQRRGARALGRLAPARVPRAARSGRSPAGRFPLHLLTPEHEEPDPQPVREPRDDPPDGSGAVRRDAPARRALPRPRRGATARGLQRPRRAEAPGEARPRPQARLRLA